LNQEVSQEVVKDDGSLNYAAPIRMKDCCSLPPPPKETPPLTVVVTKVIEVVAYF
jgi:hypothetical protein